MRVVALYLAAALAFAAGPVNMSGTWILNTAKSKWGKKTPVPHDEKIVIEHNEPKLRYSGWVQRPDGPQNAFVFDGAINGRNYPIENGTIRFTRRGPNSVESVMKSNSYEETAITTISPDGKTMTRKVIAKGPQQSVSWTEVYDKLQ